MKRKIAMLMSAMMVFSAMPMTANAAQLKSDSVQNTTFGKANETIDPNASEYTSNDYFSLDKLKSRKSVLKINLNDDGTDSITKGSSFTVKLTNGTFGDYKAGDNLNATEFGYRNENTTLNDITSKLPQNGELKDVYQIIANNMAKGNNGVAPLAEEKKVEAGKVVQIDNLGSSSDPVEKALGTLYSKMIALTDPTSQTTISEDELMKQLHTDIMAVINAYAEQETGVAPGGTEPEFKAPNLLHIPYSIELVSPTEARITLVHGLSDSDKKIDFEGVKSADVTKISLKLYTSVDRKPVGDVSIPSASPLSEDAEATEVETLASQATSLQDIKFAEIITESGAITTQKKTLENPYIALPLGGVIADGDGPVKATVTSDYNSKIVGGEYTITTNIASGSTSLIYDEKNVHSFDDFSNLDPVVIRENIRDTIGTTSNKDTTTVTLKLNGGFRFKSGAKNLKVKDDQSGRTLSVSNVEIPNDSTIKFDVSGLGNNRKNPMGLRIEGLDVEADNNNKQGDVELTVSGDGITTETKLVAKKATLGFKLETLKDPKEIISGRHYQKDTANMVEQDNFTVDIKFSEAIPNTLVESRNLEFSVPEGVKIVGMEIDNNSVKNLGGVGTGSNTLFGLDDFEVINNGQTLRLVRDSYRVQSGVAKLASFNFKLNLSVDPGFSGDIKLGVTGGGQSDVTETVIAKAVLPFEIKTQTTKLNMGYQDYDTADIVITETRPGMFLEDRYATLTLSAPYGTQELGFSKAQFEVSGGELEVKEKDFKVGEYDNTRGTISFKINKASYKNPSTITIKNVKVGTTRSVPFGAYDLKLGGAAVINNFNSDIKEDQVFNLDANINIGTSANPNNVKNNNNNPNLYNQDNTSSYDFKGYVDVVTETGTFDKTVKVSVGDKTVLVGDQAIDMDVAPYIQATSNSTMVPLRFVSVALGVDSGSVANPDASNKVAWDANTKTTTIYYGAGTGQKIIQFQAGSNIMTVDGTRIPMEYGVKAEIKDGRMFVPFRALGQALGVNVAWDADTRTAIYNGEHARNASVTTTAATTASTTTESTTESTTASDSTTESTTAKQ